MNCSSFASSIPVALIAYASLVVVTGSRHGCAAGVTAPSIDRQSFAVRVRWTPSGLELPTGQTEQPAFQRGVLGDRDCGREHADGAPLLRVGADLLPDPPYEMLRQRRIGAYHLGDVVRAKRTELVDLPKVVAGRGVGEGAVHDPVEVLTLKRCRTRPLDDRGERAVRVAAKQVSHELLRTGLLHRAPGEHVGHPRVVVRVVVDDLPQRGGVIHASRAKALRQ